MASTDGAESRLNEAVTEFLRAIPAERREELRALVREAREREQRRQADDPWESEDRDAFDQLAAARPPLPTLSPRDADSTADRIMLATMRDAGRHATALADDGGKTPGSGRADEWREHEFPKHFILLSNVHAAPVRWLSPGRVAAGKITVLDGDPGTGKSSLLCELAARISRGEALPGGEPGVPRGVLMISAEDDVHDTIRPRIDAAGGDPGRIMSLLTIPDGSATGRPFAIPGDGLLLEVMAKKMNAALVIIDPLVAYLQGGLSANSDHDVRRALATLKVVGERTGAAIVVVRHLNKSAGSNPLYRGGGSIGIIGAARCGLLLAPDPEDPQRRILAATKGNLGRLPASLAFRLEDVASLGVARVVWEGQSRWSAGALLRAAEEGEAESSALAEARSWLRAALADGPRPAKEIEQEGSARGIARRTLELARKAEGVVARKERTRGGPWLLSLPTTASDEGEDREVPTPLGLSGLSGLSGLHPDERRCVDCHKPLASGQSTRCSPCPAKRLTGEE